LPNSLADINRRQDPRGVIQANALNDNTSIHFDYARADRVERNAYLKAYSSMTLKLRGLDETGT
jgi:hypothetical protein